MSETLIIVLAVLYWTFAVAVLQVLRDEPKEQFWFGIGVAIMWPILIPVIAVALPYRAVVRSAKTIRSDLRNRKLLAEFDEFLKAKEVQK
jgi:hypothetical protein